MSRKKTTGQKITNAVIWAVGLVIITGGALMAGLHLYVSQSEAQVEGEAIVEILGADVEVTRDGVGVPHITAESEADLYRAQGYVQAQDRLFQMDLSRRQASGTLAEVVGAQAVEKDKFFRTFGLRQAAEASWEEYDTETKQILEWFAEGVNAYIEEVGNSSKLAYEFKILGYTPEPWTPVDSLTIGKYMAYDLGGNWGAQAFNHWALQNFTEQQVQEFMTKYPEDAATIVEANLQTPVEVAGMLQTEFLPNEFNGSNNWVVSGDLTKSGAPMLANDPHLGLGTPSVWYQMHLQSPEQNVSGVIFAGVPGIILGHNDNIAWGVTNVNPDVQDLYIETPNPENPYQFKYDGKWVDAKVRDEVINVKGGSPVDFEVVETIHGPIISDVILKDSGAQAVFSMQWTALQPTKELQSIIGLNKATNWDEFELALEDFMAPAQNFVFASTDGTIAYKANGVIPIRKQGTGLLPVPGDSSDYGWEGYIPYDELPTVINPEEGYIVTANNEVVGEDYPYHISNVWAQPYRYDRIVEMITTPAYHEVTGELLKLGIGEMRGMQMDKKNLRAESFLPELLTMIKEQDTEGKYARIITLLEEWEYYDDKDQSAPLVFHFLMENMQETLVKDVMPEDIYALMPGKGQVLDNMLAAAIAGEAGNRVSEVGGLDKLAYTSFEEAVATIQGKFGTNVSKWKWGSYNKLSFDHPLASANDILASYINPEKLAVGGSSVTVQAAAEDGDGHVNHGASWRFVIDMSKPATAYQLIGPGQSGHFKSKWYDNQMSNWVYGRHHKTNTNGDLPTKYELVLKASN